MAHARPAHDIADLRTREAGTRLLLPPLTVLSFNPRYIKFAGVEQTVYDYRFAQAVGDRWQVEYSGRFHFNWKLGQIVHLIATVHRHHERWHCTRVKRPVDWVPPVAPLFER